MNGATIHLFRHFFRAFFDTGAAANGERLGFATSLSLLAVPGAIIAITLMPKYSSLMRALRRQMNFDPDLASLPDKYMFIALSMAVTGVVAVLKWDTLFPDRRDFANLLPLPVSTRQIFGAKSLALAAFGFIFVFDVNAVSSVLFPLTVMENRGTVVDVLRALAAHIVAVAGAGLWTFASFIAFTGTLTAVLPYAVFRRVKRYVQFFGLTAMLLLFFSVSPVWPHVDRLQKGGSSVVEYLPSVWFLGLYQNLLGAAGGSLDPLGSRALWAMAISCCFAFAAYSLSYRRFFLKTAETSDVPARALRFPEWAYRALDATFFRTGFDRACLRFVTRTLGRSDRHTGALTALLGLGSALGAGSINAGQPLAAWFILVYSLLVGLRMSFGVTAEPRANWVFQIGADDHAHAQRVIQRLMFLFAAPLIAASTAVLAFQSGLPGAAIHIVFLSLAAMLLIELLTMDFRTIPFTCSWVPAGGNTVFALALFAAGLAVFGQGLAGFELYAIRRPVVLPFFLGFLLAAIYALHRGSGTRERITYSDTRGELELLRIGE